jgi:hypothetical protein
MGLRVKKKKYLKQTKKLLKNFFQKMEVQLPTKGSET